MAAHLSCADSDAGFDRTLLSSLHGRAAYYAEKYLLAALLSGALLVAYLSFGGLGVLVTMRPVENVEPLWQVVAWAGEGWLISCVYALAVLFVGQLVRVRAIAFIAAFLLTSAAVEQGFFTFLMLVDSALGLGWAPALEAALAWMPFAALVSVGKRCGRHACRRRHRCGPGAARPRGLLAALPRVRRARHPRELAP